MDNNSDNGFEFYKLVHETIIRVNKYRRKT